MARAIHRIFVADGIYGIILLVVLDSTLVMVRPRATPIPGYDFIWLNLALAAVPYGISLCADALFRCMPRRGGRIRFRGPLLLPLFALWLLFLPNAPYVLTDFIHLEHGTSLQIVYDTLMLGTYTVTGYALGAVSLAIMKRPVLACFGRRASRLFIITCCFLAVIGVYLGRVQHYNSWDVFSRALEVLGTILQRLVHL
jgi:uncharacterized membrane protein